MAEHLLEVARILVAADRDLETALEKLARWDVSAAHLQGRLYGITEVFSLLAGMADGQAVHDAVESARTLLREETAGERP